MSRLIYPRMIEIGYFDESVERISIIIHFIMKREAFASRFYFYELFFFNKKSEQDKLR